MLLNYSYLKENACIGFFLGTFYAWLGLFVFNILFLASSIKKY